MKSPDVARQTGTSEKVAHCASQNSENDAPFVEWNANFSARPHMLAAHDMDAASIMTWKPSQEHLSTLHAAPRTNSNPERATAARVAGSRVVTVWKECVDTDLVSPIRLSPK